MSQTFFSKLDQAEKKNRLNAIANNRGMLTIWVKGSKDKRTVRAFKFDTDRDLVVLDTHEDIFPNNTSLLCSFEFRGMNFFFQCILQKSVGDFTCLKFDGELYKSEKRSSYRLMTFPQHEVWAIFDIDDELQKSNVVNLRSKQSNTGLFNKFLTLIEGDENNPASIKIRVQDLSTTGMALHIGELESKFFLKDSVFTNVKLKFTDEEVIIPELKIVYVVDFIGTDKNIKKFKLGIQFQKLSSTLDLLLGKKINSLLRESDHNKDFENFKK